MILLNPLKRQKKGIHNMKVLVISQYYYPETFKITSLCEELYKENNQITVLTGLPNYPKGEIYEGYQNIKSVYEETIHGVRVLRVPIRPRYKGAKNLFLNYVSYMRLAKKQLKRMNDVFDYILVYEISPVLQIVPALYYGKKKKIPVFTYCQDVWPDSLKVGGMKETNIVYKFFKLWSKKLYNKSNYILVSSPSFKEHLVREHHCDKNKIYYLPQHANDYLINKNLDKSVNHTTDFLYVGNIGKAQNILFLIKAFERINREDVVFHIVGNGSEFEKCNSYVRENNLKYIIFYGSKSQNQLLEYYQKADACVFALNAEGIVSSTIPAKLQDYMASGKPIIASISNDAKDLIEKSKCGLCSEANDMEGLIQNINYFIENKEALMQYGQNGRQYFLKHFTVSVCAKKLKTIMEESK